MENTGLSSFDSQREFPSFDSSLGSSMVLSATGGKKYVFSAVLGFDSFPATTYGSVSNWRQKVCVYCGFRVMTVNLTVCVFFQR